MRTIVSQAVAYRSERNSAAMRGREIMIETKTPELTEQERAERYRAIECGLFEIFVKYAG